ncbi:MAG: calcium/sodium antiporter [Spirochaetaceae bacterium]|nr:calcium/sodium antiporter [Myxococcales bacterium]MCB9723084.1 calcium/sodium antiporter [Spirochaetaceae bacterium]HPG24156.1 calcium/sodium antiporter [Myxococcota bacterium]
MSNAVFEPLLWIVVSLVVLTVGAELLVVGAVAIAERFRVSSLFIGLTIVGFGTSMPELFTSLAAARLGSSDLAVGNVVGSNVFNIGVVLGLAALVAPIATVYSTLRPQLYWALGAALVPALALGTGGRLGGLAGGVLILGLAAYLWQAFVMERAAAPADAARPADASGAAAAAGPAPVAEAVDPAPIGPRTSPPALESAPRTVGWLASLGRVASGMLLLVLGASRLVDSAILVARELGASELAIGLTVVAGGTSLPELVTSLVAAVRGESNVAIGNVLGSNVFNAFGILGVSSLLSPQTIGPQVLGFDTPVLVGMTLLLFPMLRSGDRLDRREAALLLIGYGVYAWALFGWAPARFGG